MSKLTGLSLPFIGIDFGSKLAGTTVISYVSEQEIRFAASEKKKDADRFILDWVEKFAPNQIFLDAPLSLPGVYRELGKDYDDYFYRQADRTLNAMSPMFLGGLTARAMRLDRELKQQNVNTIEVYPGKLAQHLALKKQGYKMEKARLPILVRQILPLLPYPINELETSLPTWHHFDALLALLSGWRYHSKTHQSVGDEREGLIII